MDTAVRVLAMYPVVDLTNRHGIRQQDRMDGFITRRIIQQTREAAPHVFEDGSPLSWIQRDGVARRPRLFVSFKVPTIRWCGSKKCAALLRSSAPLRPTLLFTQSCRAPSMRLRFSIRRAPVTFSSRVYLVGMGSAQSGQVTASPDADAEENMNQADNGSDHD